MNGTRGEDGIRTESIAQSTSRTTIRRFVFERDVDEVTQLFGRIFQKPSNRELWKWKYLPPWTDEPYAWVTTSGDQITGHCGAVPLRGQIKGEETLFFQLGDIMADPDFRSLDIYQQMSLPEVARELRRKHPKAVFYGFTGERLGFWYTWFTSLGRSTFVERAADRIVRLPPGDEIDHDSEFEIRQWPWDAPELNEIWSQQGDTIRVGLIRDQAFLEWRYALHPVFQYSLFGVQQFPAGRKSL